MTNLCSRSQQLLPELEIEAAKTRRLFEALPEGHAHFKPHVRSMALGRLAGHTSDLYRIIALSLTSADLDWDTWKAYTMTTKTPLLEKLDENVLCALNALRTVSDDTLTQRWRIYRGARDLFDGERYTAYRFNGMNQIIHHRAQLGTYIRALDLPLPGMYGPSADGI